MAITPDNYQVIRERIGTRATITEAAGFSAADATALLGRMDTVESALNTTGVFVAPGATEDEDMTADIQAALSAGGKVILDPTATYGISGTLSITVSMTDLDGVIGGGITAAAGCRIKALPGFSGGEMLEINIAHGDKGAWVRNITLDGNNEAGVTTGVSYATGTISVAHLFDVAIQNVPTPIKTGSNCQSLVWERVLAFTGAEIGVDIGADNRHITARSCRFGGTTTAARIGADTATLADRTETIIFDACELYGRAGASSCVLVRASENTRLTNCYIEAEDTMDSLVQLGTATSNAAMPILIGNRFAGNANAVHAVRFLNTTYPTVIGKGTDNNFSGADIGNDDSDSFGFVIGLTVDDTEGLVLALGDPVLANPQWKTPITFGAASGFNGFEAWVTGDTVPRYALNNNAGLAMSDGTNPADAFVLRIAANMAGTATGDSFFTEGTWNGGHLVMGTKHLWIDATGDLRISEGPPGSDTAGTVVGSQS